MRKAYGFPTARLPCLLIAARLGLAAMSEIQEKYAPVRQSLTAHRAAKPQTISRFALSADGTSALPASTCAVRRNAHSQYQLACLGRYFRVGINAFQFFFHSRQKSFNRFVDATLQSSAKPRLAHQAHAGMQVPRAVPAQFHLL